MPKSDNINRIIDHKLFSEDDIHNMCVRLGKQLTQDYAGKTASSWGFKGSHLLLN